MDVFAWPWARAAFCCLSLQWAASAAESAAQDGRPPAVDVVRRLEGAIVLPAGAARLGEYDRLYTEIVRDGRPTIIGQLTRRSLSAAIARSRGQSPVPPIRYGTLSDFSVFQDGGCSTLTLTYEPGATTPPSPSCGTSLTLKTDLGRP